MALHNVNVHNVLSGLGRYTRPESTAKKDRYPSTGSHRRSRSSELTGIPMDWAPIMCLEPVVIGILGKAPDQGSSYPYVPDLE
jgi:hypothetical protein